MKVDPFPCDCCPDQHKDLLLIETRFEGHECFAELQCRVCQALWTAEIGPRSGSPDPFASGIENQPGWRVLGLTPRIAR